MDLLGYILVHVLVDVLRTATKILFFVSNMLTGLLIFTVVTNSRSRLNIGGPSSGCE